MKCRFDKVFILQWVRNMRHMTFSLSSRRCLLAYKWHLTVSRCFIIVIIHLFHISILLHVLFFPFWQLHLLRKMSLMAWIDLRVDGFSSYSSWSWFGFCDRRPLCRFRPSISVYHLIVWGRHCNGCYQLEVSLNDANVHIESKIIVVSSDPSTTERRNSLWETFN